MSYDSGCCSQDTSFRLPVTSNWNPVTTKYSRRKFEHDPLVCPAAAVAYQRVSMQKGGVKKFAYYLPDDCPLSVFKLEMRNPILPLRCKCKAACVEICC